MYRNFASVLLSVCICVCTFSGCKKESTENATAENAATENAQQDVKAVDDNNQAPAVEVPKSAAVQAADLGDDHGMKEARERARLKYHTPVCPEGADLQGEQCVCPGQKGMGAEGECVLGPKAVTRTGKGFKCVPNMWECFHTVMCTDPNGCDTKEGMHFGPYYAGGFIRGGVDTLPESEDERGECVLDRVDGIKLYSELSDKSGDFACDREFCRCSDTTCILGEVCKGGKCMEDDSPMPVLNDDNSTELETDSLPLYLEVPMPKVVFNAHKCAGGKVMCHGLDNPPIPRPEASDEYECLTVSELPGFDKMKKVKAWVCPFRDGCPCGSGTCQKGQACYDSQCI